VSLTETLESFSETRTLIVIGGPIASGKSSLARSVARRFTECGIWAATIDLDLVYEMLDHSDSSKADARTWSRARRVAAAFTEALLDIGVRVVIAEGDFVRKRDRAEFVTALQAPSVLRFVTLNVPLATALVRVGHDPTRGRSRDPAFLKRHYDEVAEVLRERAAAETDLFLDTSKITVDDAALAIIDWSLGPGIPTQRASCPRS
jgi:chloramphenicol 3-O-phosphotransferase